HRRRLPAERTAITHKFEIAGHEGYITVGLYPDGQPGEIFLKMAKEGSTVSGLMDSFATATSVALQYGVPLRDLVNKFAHVRFEPAGFTGNPEIPIAKSLVDYIFRWLGSRFLPADERASLGLINREGGATDAPTGPASAALPAEEAAARAEGVRSPLRAGQSAPSGTASAQLSGADTPRPAEGPAEPPSGIDLEDKKAIVIPLAEHNGHTNGNGSSKSGGATPAVLPVNLGGGPKVSFEVSADSPSCAECGSIMVRNGSCYKCLNCGSTSGCS
ncbi:MAG TPA: vitamin B12-dependent ribonucleotide reductase, partial [Candidatus Dormibacteraeota bacterium]|nr:vitamin B12-dependent ribonucleotide reductase [Candidatus Dormibacteraeota bacterium]